VETIALVPGAAGVHPVDRAEPTIDQPNQVMLKTLRVGICGTDREEVAGGRARAPEGRHDLVIGHEMFGQVVAVGSQVSRVQVGDHALFAVRRTCGACLACAMNRPDMCSTGEYRERGIWGLDGYQAEHVVDEERYVVRVPPELAPIGVLTEPLSVVEKAIEEAVGLQTSRLPDAPASPDWLFGRHCLVAGMGPIGLLASVALLQRGAEAYGLDHVDEGSFRPQWLIGIGGRYVDSRQVPPDKVDDRLGPMDLILEATGAPSVAFNLLDALAPNGVYVMTGIPGGDGPLQIAGAELMRQLVLDNQVMLGSVNAARGHFQLAVDDLARAHLRWPGQVERLITHRYPHTDAAAALQQQASDEDKVVVEWAA
jgi:threonine dehydrogenase-like Zn-dependent dehydrogenase